MQRKEINDVIMLFIVFDKRESITAPLQIKNRIYLHSFLCKNDSLTLPLHLNYKTENKNKTIHISHKHYFVPDLSFYAAYRRFNVVLTDTCRRPLDFLASALTQGGRSQSQPEDIGPVY